MTHDPCIGTQAAEDAAGYNWDALADQMEQLLFAELWSDLLGDALTPDPLAVRSS